MIHRRLPITVALALALPSLAVPARALPAPPAGPLVITTRVMVEQRRPAPDGTTRIVLAKPTNIGPGDRVVVIVGYRNTGKQPLADVALADPLPRSIAYVGAHAGSPEPDVSVDGRSYAPLATLRITAPAGPRVASRADVTAVRWRLPRSLTPGEAGELSFDATVR